MRKARGVTLIEMLFTISLTAIILIAVGGIVVGVQRQWTANISRGKSVQAANLAMEQMVRDMQNAVTFLPTDGVKTNTFTLPADTDAQGNYLPVRVGALLQYAAGKRIRYYLSDSTGVPQTGTILWRETNAAPTGDNGWVPDTAWSLLPGSGSKGKVTGVTALSFTTAGLPANVAQISLTVQATEGKQIAALTLQRAIYLSNHN